MSSWQAEEGRAGEMTGPRIHQASGEMWGAGTEEAGQDRGYSGPCPAERAHGGVGAGLAGGLGRHIHLYQPTLPAQPTVPAQPTRLSGLGCNGKQKQRRGAEPGGD